jgi:DNA-binding MarR family transcriptional regulator
MDLLNTLGPMTAGELAGRTGLSSGATTRLIDRMERAGYVRRRSDEHDRRCVIVEPVETRTWVRLEPSSSLLQTG